MTGMRAAHPGPHDFLAPPIGAPLSFGPPPIGRALSFGAPPIRAALSFAPPPMRRALCFRAPPIGARGFTRLRPCGGRCGLGLRPRGPMCFEFLLWGARRPGVVMRGGRRRQGRPLACSVTGWGVRHLPRPSPMASLSFHVKPGASSSGAGSSQLPKATNLEQLETASSGAGARRSRNRETWSNGKVAAPERE